MSLEWLSAAKVCTRARQLVEKYSTKWKFRTLSNVLKSCYYNWFFWGPLSSWKLFYSIETGVCYVSFSHLDMTREIQNVHCKSQYIIFFSPSLQVFVSKFYGWMCGAESAVCQVQTMVGTCLAFIRELFQSPIWPFNSMVLEQKFRQLKSLFTQKQITFTKFSLIPRFASQVAGFVWE